MTRARALGAALAAAAALMAAGCGSDEPEVSAAEQWAGDVCTAVNTWRNSIADTAASLTANPTRDGLESAADDARETTETLIDTVRGLGAPETESGEEAGSTLEELADTLDSDIATIQEAVEDVSGVQGLLDAAATVSATVAKISADLSAAGDELRALGDVDDELQQAFSDADACEGVVPTGS